MTIARSAAAGAVVGGGVGYAWARKQGRSGREAATMVAKSAVAGGVGGMAVGAGVARRRRSPGAGGGRAAAAVALARGVAEAAGELVDDLEQAVAPVLETVVDAVEESADDVRSAARA